MPPKAKVTTVEKDTQDVVVVEKKAVKKTPVKEPVAEKAPAAKKVVAEKTTPEKEPVEKKKKVAEKVVVEKVVVEKATPEKEPVEKKKKVAKEVKEPVAAEVEPKVDGEADHEDESKRGSDAIGLMFPPSRVKLHINRYINGVLDAELALVKEEATKIEDAVKKSELDDKCHALTRAKTRFADISPTVMALVLDYMVRGIAHEGMNHALHAEDKKTVTKKHILASSGKSAVAALYENLPVFVDALKESDEPVVRSPEEDAGDASEEPVETSDDAPKAEGSLTDRSKFNSYISKVFTAVKLEFAEYKTMRVASDTIVFMNDLVVSTIQRLCVMLRVLLEVKGAKTVDSDMVMYAVQLALNDGHVATNTIEYVKEMQKHTDKDTAVKGDKEVLVAYVKVDYATSSYNNLNKYVEAKVQEFNQWRDNKESLAVSAKAESAKVEAPVVA